MESLESMLRDEFREAPVFDGPPVTDLLKAAGIGSRWRVARQAFVGVVVLGLLVGVVVTFVTRPRSIGPNGDSGFSSPQDAAEHAFGLPVEGTFLDAQHGWVTIERCWHVDTTDPSTPTRRCADYLEVTSDGGVTFTEHALPTVATPQFYHLYVFDATHLVLAESLASPSSEPPFPSHVPGMVDKSRYVSSDGGETWTPVSLTPGAPVDVIPPGGQIVIDGTGGQPTMVLTPDGVAHPLSPAAAFSTPENTLADVPVAPIAGAYYVYDGQVMDTVNNLTYNGYGKLWVSHDQGRTWTASVVPPHIHQFTPIGSDGHWAYAWGYDERPGDPAQYFASLNGVDWQQIPTPAVPETPYDVSNVTLPQVGLFIDDGNGLWQTSGTAPFSRIQDATRTRSMVGCGPVAVALRITPDGTITIATTADGLHWTDGTIS